MIFFVMNGEMFTRGHNLRICKPPCRSDLFLNSFANRAINCWNWLPNNVVNMNSIKGFSAKLDSINFEKYIKGRLLFLKTEPLTGRQVAGRLDVKKCFSKQIVFWMNSSLY